MDAEISELYGLSIIELGIEDIEYSSDSLLAEKNYRAYRTKRGRTCAYPGCGAKLRYTREVPVCSLHELTDFAQRHTAAPRGRGRASQPKLRGLRDVLSETGVSTRELAVQLGRPQNWVQRVARCEFGAKAEVRACMAGFLGVSETRLLERDA